MKFEIMTIEGKISGVYDNESKTEIQMTLKSESQHTDYGNSWSTENWIHDTDCKCFVCCNEITIDTISDELINSMLDYLEENAHISKFEIKHEKVEVGYEKHTAYELGDISSCNVFGKNCYSPDIIESFDCLEKAKEALKEYHSSVSLSQGQLGKLISAEEYWIEESIHNSDGDYLEGGTVWEVAPLDDDNLKIWVYGELVGDITSNHSMTFSELIELCPRVKVNNPDVTGEYGDYALYQTDDCTEDDFLFTFNEHDKEVKIRVGY